MAWYELVEKLYQIIDRIATDLIADAAWEEGDATWDTSVRTNENAKRVVHHIADDIYLALIAGNLSRRAGTTAYYGKGLFIVISSAWVGNEPSGDIQHTFIPFEGDNATVYGDLATIDITYKLFTGADGFALVGIPAIYAGDVYQSNFIAVVERIATKFYADGYTNFYVFTEGNFMSTSFYSYDCGADKFGIAVRWYKYLRPFIYRTSYAGYYEERERIYSAYKSLADNKAYYMKPILQNSSSRKPWAQAEFWIPVDSVKINLADDDEIALPAPATKKYQVTLKQSPDSALYIYYAIIKQE